MNWWEQAYVYDIGVAQFVSFVRPLYPPDDKDGPVQNGPDVEAVKRAVSRLGRWPWPGTGTPPAPAFDQAYSNAFAHGKSGNVGETGLEGVQRQARIAKASGNMGERSYDVLLYARIPKGLPHAGEFAMDQKAIALLQQAANQFPKDEPASEPAPPAARDTIVSTAMLGYHKAAQIHYTQGPQRMQGVREQIRPDAVPSYEDCSSFATWCYWVAGAPDPNGLGYNGTGYTGTQVSHGRGVGLAGRNPGDLIFYGSSWSSTTHVALVAQDTRYVVSHGSEGGPYYCAYDYRSDIVGVRSYL
jgi:hypothetical protein